MSSIEDPPQNRMKLFIDFLEEKSTYHARNHTTMSEWTGVLAGIHGETIWHDIQTVIKDETNDVNTEIPVFLSADIGHIIPIEFVSPLEFAMIAELIFGKDNFEIETIYEDPSKKEYYIHRIHNKTNGQLYDFYFNDGRRYSPNTPPNQGPMTWRFRCPQAGNPLQLQFLHSTLEHLHQRLLRLER